jgi:hypothetical protein
VRRFLREWDRLMIYLLLATYGAYSTVYPIVSFERAAPHWAEILLGSEFAIAGVLLIIGMGRRRGYRLAGLGVVAVGLSTISLSVAIVGGTRVLGYAFLFGAFAMQSIFDIRREQATKRDAKRSNDDEVIRRELEELARTANNGGTER